MLEFHELEIARNEVKIGGIGRSHHLRDRPGGLVAYGAIECFPFADVQFRLMTEEGGERGLRIEIDRQHPIAAQGEILRKVSGCRRLARTTFEIHDGDDLQLFARSTMRNIFAGLAAFVENPADTVDVLHRIHAAAV